MINNDFVFLDIGKIIIVRDNNQKIYYKEINKELHKLTEEELLYVNNIFNKYNGYTYYSEQLRDLINSNDYMVNKVYYIPLLEFLERIIPDECKDNLYRNISSLKISINYEEKEEENYSSVAIYNTNSNSLVINNSALKRLWKTAQKAKNTQDFYAKELNSTILHELTHMASANYNEDTFISLCGYDKYPSDSIEDYNRGLTEGMTEVIAITGFPGTVEIASDYYIEVLFINQLIQIVGLDTMLSSYFANKGTKDIESKLNTIIDDKSIAFNLFRRIEDNYQIRHLNVNQSILGNIQMTLVNYLEQKILLGIIDGKISDDEIKATIKRFEEMLVTPEKLQIMKKDPAKYGTLAESIERFYEVKKRFIENNNSNKVL